MGVFGWLPGRRTAAYERAHARRKALGGLEFSLAELGHDLSGLAELSDQNDAAAASREAAIASLLTWAPTRLSVPGGNLWQGSTEPAVSSGARTEWPS